MVARGGESERGVGGSDRLTGARGREWRAIAADAVEYFAAEYRVRRGLCGNGWRVAAKIQSSAPREKTDAPARELHAKAGRTAGGVADNAFV